MVRLRYVLGCSWGRAAHPRLCLAHRQRHLIPADHGVRLQHVALALSCRVSWHASAFIRPNRSMLLMICRIALQWCCQTGVGGGACRCTLGGSVTLAGGCIVMHAR